jgi:hypothetical protein
MRLPCLLFALLISASSMCFAESAAGRADSAATVLNEIM